MRSISCKQQCTYISLVCFHYDPMNKLPRLSASQTGTCLGQEATFLLSRVLSLITFKVMSETYFLGWQISLLRCRKSEGKIKGYALNIYCP